MNLAKIDDQLAVWIYKGDKARQAMDKLEPIYRHSHLNLLKDYMIGQVADLLHRQIEACKRDPNELQRPTLHRLAIVHGIKSIRDQILGGVGHHELPTEIRMCQYDALVEFHREIAALAEQQGNAVGPLTG